MPMYGNDCSGFVSIAWGIERTDTATFIEGMKKGRFKKKGIQKFPERFPECFKKKSEKSEN